MNDFLKKMQEALVEGKEDSDVKEYMKTIDDMASKVKNPSKSITDRLDNIGKREVATDEELKLVGGIKGLKEHNKNVLNEKKKEDEKWEMLAIIENMKTELKTLKSDYETLKKKYEKNISEVEENIDKGQEEFEKEFGEVSMEGGFEKIKKDYEEKQEESKENEE